MHNFLYLKIKHGDQRNTIVDSIAKNLVDGLTFIPKRLEVRSINNEEIFISALASEYWKAGTQSTDNRPTAFDGLPFYKDSLLSEHDDWAHKLYELFLRNSVDEVYESLHGQFSILHSNKERTIAFGDSSGSKPIFYIETPALVAISNRQSLLSPMCTYDRYRSINLKAFSWAISQLHIFGNESVYAGVKLLPPGQFISIGDNCNVKFHRFRTQIWSSVIDKSQVDEIDYDEATADLISSYKPISKLADRIPGKIHLSLTGGKDSRLGLALCQAAGLAERLNFFTYGSPENPEVQVAAHLCKQMGVPHTALHGDASKELDVDLSWKRIRQSAFRFDFSHGGVDGGYMPSKHQAPDVDLTGSYADIFRRIWQHSRKLDFSNVNAARNVWNNWPVTNDALGVLQPDVISSQRSEINSWIDEKLDQGIRLNDLPEVFYVENRMTWWAGPINTTNLGRIRLVPLSSLKAARIGLSPTVGSREREHLHFHVIKRTSEQLLRAPFLNDVWHSDLREAHKGLGLANQPFSVQKLDSKGGQNKYLDPWYAHFIKCGSKDIRSYLLDSPNTGLFDIVSHDKVNNALANPTSCSGAIQSRQIINLLLTQIALQRDYSCPRDDIRIGATEFISNIPSLSIVNDSEKYSASFNNTKKTGGFNVLPRTTKYQSSATEQHLLADKIRTYVFKIGTPGHALFKLRIDPCNAPGLIKIYKTVIQIDSKKEIVLSFNEITAISQAIALHNSSDSLVLNSTGDDPNISFDCSKFGINNTFTSVTATITAMIENGSYMDVHWDSGHGFNSNERSRLPL